MDSKNQLTTFLLCLLCGFLGGLIYEIFAFFRLIFGCDREKNKVLGILLDLCFFVFLAIFYFFCAFSLHFPDFRVYMWVGFGLGGVLYLKSLRRMVAFVEKMCYNTFRKIANKIKNRKKLSNAVGAEKRTSRRKKK